MCSILLKNGSVPIRFYCFSFSSMVFIHETFWELLEEKNLIFLLS
jgi:hypothetical protein